MEGFLKENYENNNNNNDSSRSRDFYWNLPVESSF